MASIELGHSLNNADILNQPMAYKVDSTGPVLGAGHGADGARPSDGAVLVGSIPNSRIPSVSAATLSGCSSTCLS
jgi:hypothetical protein